MSDGNRKPASTGHGTGSILVNCAVVSYRNRHVLPNFPVACLVGTNREPRGDFDVP